MKSLDDTIADVEKLDGFRQKARRLQQEAVDVLSANTYGGGENWEAAQDRIEKAQVLRALALGQSKNEHRQSNIDALMSQLRSIKYRQFEQPAAGDEDLPALQAAYILHALAQTPDEALSEASMACFCRIVRELSDIVDPTWAAGAARAGDKATATAFVTGQCARALLALKDAIEQTGEVASLFKNFAARKKILAPCNDVWSNTELQRLHEALDVSIGALPPAIVRIERSADNRVDVEATSRAISKAIAGMPEANAVMRALSPPDPKMSPRKFAAASFAYAANMMAWNALHGLRETLLGTRIAGDAMPSREPFRDGAQIIADILRQIEPFAESIIDREIAAASQQLSIPVDGAELVFAATLLGLVRDWNRPKIRAAYEVLVPLLSSNGRLLSIRPFNFDLKGYRLNVATLEVTRRFADLIACLDVEPEPEFVARLMLPLDYTRVPGKSGTTGWTTDPPPREPKSLWWLTAIAARTLNSIETMLDKTINRRILPLFHVRWPKKIDLNDAFYPDYGIAQQYSETGRSVAFELLQLCRHAGHGPPEKDPVFSLLLFGPPGTGKTTLAEAVAASAKAPLVEITPSDILVGGVEGIERRTRLTFQALSKLTNALILFDEFEQILLKRDDKPTVTPTSVTQFLTAGMLPKLKALYDASKEGRVSFILATNLLDSIDPAIKRDGRFDRRCGVYPPDVISRFGRLRDQFRSFKAPANEAKAEVETRRWRLIEVVADTAGGPMSTLGKPGWFTWSKNEEDRKGKAFGYIIDKQPKTEIKKVKPEAVYGKAAAKEERGKPRESDPSYWEPWLKIRAADETSSTEIAQLKAGVDDDTWNQLGTKIDEWFARDNTEVMRKKDDASLTGASPSSPGAA